MSVLSPIDWAVLAAAFAAIAWINWYFFVAGSRRGTVAAAAVRGAQEVVIAVQGGYEPRTIQVKAGRPVRLVFDRQETSSCSEEVVLADFGIRRFPPAFERTVVEVTPPAPGQYEFTCGMSMLRGRIVAD